MILKWLFAEKREEEYAYKKVFQVEGTHLLNYVFNELKTKVKVTMFTNIEFKKAKTIKETWTKKLE
jgi:hypothetical protein